MNKVIDKQKRYWWRCFRAWFFYQLLTIDALIFVFFKQSIFSICLLLLLNMFFSYMNTPDEYCDEEVEFYKRNWAMEFFRLILLVVMTVIVFKSEYISDSFLQVLAWIGGYIFCNHIFNYLFGINIVNSAEKIIKEHNHKLETSYSYWKRFQK